MHESAAQRGSGSTSRAKRGRTRGGQGMREREGGLVNVLAAVPRID